MIAEFRVSNFFSIRSEQTISFVATPDKFMNEEYCNNVTDDVSLLKIGVIYGANASGKSNVLKALSFFKQLMQRVPQDRNGTSFIGSFLSCGTRCINCLKNESAFSTLLLPEALAP